MFKLPAIFKRRPPNPPKISARHYAAAVLDRLTQDWTATSGTADRMIGASLRIVRQRARQQERDNDHVKSYLRLLENNVLGHKGIRLQVNAVDNNGSQDKGAKKEIEPAWKRWGKKKNCSWTQDYTWWGMCRHVLRSTSRDGGILVRRYRNADNPFRYSLDILEGDHLNHNWNQDLPNGHTIRNGRERDTRGRTVAFWIYEKHPEDFLNGGSHSLNHTRVSANDYWYIQAPERIKQSIGMCWFASAMTRLNMLSGYEEAELVASRQAACKAGFFKKQVPDSWGGEVDSNGAFLTDVRPGEFEELPMGFDFQPYDPQHPHQSYGDYIKWVLRGIAAGLGIDYNSLANDLEGVNYSSIRSGVLETREHYKMIQQWLIDEFVQPVYEEWLEMAMLAGQVNLPMAKFDKFSDPIWRGRRWSWVDPTKEVAAKIAEINFGLNSRRATIAETSGEDIEDVFDEIAADEKLQEDKELEFTADTVGKKKGSGESVAKVPGEDE